MASDEERWVVAPDEARIEIAVGHEAKLSPGVQEALDNLMRVLESQQDVEGYFSCEKVFIRECRQYMLCGGVVL
jgi:hypothetical protein